MKLAIGTLEIVVHIRTKTQRVHNEWTCRKCKLPHRTAARLEKAHTPKLIPMQHKCKRCRDEQWVYYERPLYD